MGFIEKDKNIPIKIDKASVLRAAGCREGDVLYDSVSSQYDEIEEKINTSLEVKRTVFEENGIIYVVITAGEKISGLAEHYFSIGEGVAGLLINTAADEAVFEADGKTSEMIKYHCAKTGKGILKRYEAPTDISLVRQAEILRKAPVGGVSLTDGLMLSPVKSMAYKLELTDDETVFKAQHDCSRCPNKSCPRRTAEVKGEFEIVSDFDYIPKTSDCVCIDIGTTTIAAVNFENGRLKKSHSEINMQRRFGADVLSRIEAANRGRQSELQSVIEYQINKAIEAVDGVGKRVIVAANTTMVSLFMGFDCTEMGVYPFKSETLETVTCGNITLVGGISTFVGGDITSGLYMCNFHESERINIFIDLGTNGEMAIGNKHKILCTSTAAGPAFEGGRISCGIGSVEGAVCAVDLKNNKIETIGGKKPCGICGTGIAELVSELIDSGTVDKSGLMREGLGGIYKLCDNVSFTQKDIRELQMAKSAVRAGIEILIERFGCDEDKIENVYIAGGFGKRLNIEKACNIGLLPPRFKGRYKAVGNSALGGAVKLSENSDGFAMIDKIRAVSSDFSLAELPEFSEKFIQYMEF